MDKEALDNKRPRKKRAPVVEHKGRYSAHRLVDRLDCVAAGIDSETGAICKIRLPNGEVTEWTAELHRVIEAFEQRTIDEHTTEQQADIGNDRSWPSRAAE